MKFSFGSLFSRRNNQPKRVQAFEFDAESYTMTRAMFRNSLVARTATRLIKWSVWCQIHLQPMLNRLNWQVMRSAALILAISFIAASTVSTYSAKMAFSLFAKPTKGGDTANAKSFRAPITTVAKGSSIRELGELILSRNLFNSEGTLAPESKADGATKTATLDFESVPCSTEKLPVDVLGTIYTGDPTASFVALKDAKIQDADIYKVGEVVIDNEEIEVWRVKQGFAEFRRGDKKICVDVAGRSPVAANTSSAPAAVAARPDAVETIDITDAELKNLLGPEMARAMSEAKLIPDVQPGSGQLQGFRLLAIVPGSVFDRLKLQNEDLLVEVNGVSMKDPTQGFRPYEALQQQREISINFTRKGEPMVRKVRVK